MKLLLRLLFVNTFFFSFFTSNAQVVINEWMASNTSNIADDFGEFDDWIEIYNPSGSSYDLAGNYMTDDPADLTKWQIPTDAGAAVQIAAGGYLLLWADNDGEQGPTHLEFKLSGSGESILIVAADGTTIIDQVDFAAQGNDVSYGRFPDGADNFEFFPNPTPESSNESGGTINIPIDLSVPLTMTSDDASEFFGKTRVDKNPQNLGSDGGVPITAGFRFPNISFDKTATITEAYIQFASLDDQGAAADFTIQISSDFNAPTCVDGDNPDISTRDYINESVNWQVPAWTAEASAEEQRTASLIPLIQAWSDQAGWQSGTTAFFKIEGTGSRNAYSFEGDSDKSARLIIRGSVEIPSAVVTDLKINEIAAAGTTHRDDNEKAEDWIELYNNGTSTISTTGLYLTDDDGNLDKWNLPLGRTIPAGGFIKFFLDNDPDEGSDHANFSLRSRGEWVGVVQQTNTGLMLLDSISWAEIPFMATYGRIPNGSGDYNLLGEFTPEASNNDAKLYLAPPTIMVPSGIYTDGPNVGISHSESDVDIYYTLDGNIPNAASSSYIGEVTINTSGPLRAVAVKAGYAPSQPANSSYMVGESSNIPVLFMTTAPGNLFDDDLGIYVDGTNGVVAYCSAVPVNWARDWERPGNLTLVYPDGTIGFDTNAGIKISGACSRNLPMKSFAITTKEQEFGDGKFSGDIFPQRDHNNFYELKIRNSGQDYIRLGFRDLMNQQFLMDKLDVPVQAGITTQLFINGEFWGVYNLREKYSKNYFAENYGTDVNKLDIIKSPGMSYVDVKEGTDAEYLELFNWMENANLANSGDFDLFSEQVDLNNFISYWSTMTLLSNYDWPANNITIWKERKSGKKWSYCMADTDGSTNNFLSATEADQAHFNTLATISDPNSTVWPNHNSSTRFIRKAWENPDFAAEFAQRSCSIMDMIYPTSIVEPAVDSIAGLFDPHIEKIFDRWNGVDPSQPDPLGGDRFSWEDWVIKYKAFFEQRPDFMRTHLTDKFGFSGTYKLTFVVDADTKGKVVVNWNEMEVPFNHLGTYFQNVPLTVKAIANQGFAFVRWEETGVTDAEIQFVENGDVTLTPIFEAICIAGSSCDDDDGCTVDDVFDSECNCKGTFADADEDGVCDEEDICEGYDDNMDSDGDGIPDGCDSVGDGLAIAPGRTIKVFPNPSNGNVLVELREELRSETLILRNYLGQPVNNVEYNRLEVDQISINCDKCFDGLYFLTIETEDGKTIQQSLIIMK